METHEDAEEFRPEAQRSSSEVEEWGTTTTVGLLAGMVYGGLREAASPSPSQRKALLPPRGDAGDSSPLGPKPEPISGEPQPLGTTRARQRHVMEQRLVQISKGTVRGGLAVGSMTSLFSGVQLGLSVLRETRDTLNTVVAGSVTAGALGLAAPGTVPRKLQGACLGAIVGGLLSLPFGLMQASLSRLVPPSDVKTTSEVEEGSRKRDGVGEAIQRMQRRLDHREVPNPQISPSQGTDISNSNGAHSETIGPK